MPLLLSYLSKDSTAEQKKLALRVAASAGWFNLPTAERLWRAAQELLASDDPEIRAEAVSAVDACPTADGIHELEKMLTNETDERVCRYAVTVLGRHGDISSVEPIDKVQKAWLSDRLLVAYCDAAKRVIVELNSSEEKKVLLSFLAGEKRESEIGFEDTAALSRIRRKGYKDMIGDIRKAWEKVKANLQRLRKAESNEEVGYHDEIAFLYTLHFLGDKLSEEEQRFLERYRIRLSW